MMILTLVFFFESFGVLLWELYEQELPWTGVSDRGNQWARFNKDFEVFFLEPPAWQKTSINYQVLIETRPIPSFSFFSLF